MIGPLRKDVLVTGFVLAIPVFLLGVRGEFTADEVITRLLWCLGAGWAAVALVRWASTPPAPPKPAARRAAARATADPDADGHPEPTAP